MEAKFWTEKMNQIVKKNWTNLVLPEKFKKPIDNCEKMISNKNNFNSKER